MLQFQDTICFHTDLLDRFSLILSKTELLTEQSKIKSEMHLKRILDLK